MAKSKKRRRRRRHNVVGRVLLVFLCLVLIVFAAGALYYNSLLNRLSFDRGTTGALSQPIATAAVEPVDGTPQEPVPTPNQPILSDEIQHITSGNKAEGEVRRAKNIVNVLLIGSDYRIPNTSDPGRADVTMLASLNKKTGEIKLVSFERGIMVEVPGVGTDLLTHSFHWGGAELTTNIIRDYFLLDVAGYAHVDFDSFASLVNAVGGVDITLTDAEAWALKKTAGLNHLDGADALRYCRLRSIDSNWQRIARQRTTVQAILNQVRDMNLTELNRLAETVLPLIHTDLSKGEITSILMSAPKVLGKTAEQMAVPDHNDQHCDFQYESDRLQSFLYG